MRYTDPTLRDMLAGEYVLGTLRGPARRRFERLLAQDGDLRELVGRWEGKLNLLVEALPPVEPPKRIWEQIEHSLWPESPRASVWSSLRLWRGLALVSSTFALVLAAYLGLRPVPEVVPEVLAILTSQEQQAGWVVTLTRAVPGRLQVRALAGLPPRSGESYELWIIPEGAKVPLSLGLLPVAGSAVLTVPDRVKDAVARPGALAVSLEPKGGSPTGLPTGPVLYQGRLLRL
jgi:anti-sigma-K factor RskA